MNVLITGARGFIGTHLIEHIGNQHKVTTYDLKDGQDIRDLYTLETAFETSQCNMVIHLAARAGVPRSILYPGEYITTNIEGTWNVVKMCEKYDCRLINFSSASVYGNGKPPLSETSSLHPISLYGMTKVCAENIVEHGSMQAITIRPFNVYGLKGRGDQVFYKWLNQLNAKKKITIYMDDNSCRSYTCVNDLVDIVYKLIIRKWKDKYDVFNIGGREIITIKDVVNLFRAFVPGFDNHTTYIKAPATDITASYANITKAKKMLGYNPPANFGINLQELISAYRGERHGSL